MRSLILNCRLKTIRPDALTTLRVGPLADHRFTIGNEVIQVTENDLTPGRVMVKIEQGDSVTVTHTTQAKAIDIVMTRWGWANDGLDLRDFQ